MTHFRLRYHKGSFLQEEFFLSERGAVARAASLIGNGMCHAFTLHDPEGMFLMGESDLARLGRLFAAQGTPFTPAHVLRGA